MRAIWFERKGGPDVLEVRDEPEPTPGDGELLVEVEAVGVNYRDVYEREGGRATARSCRDRRRRGRGHDRRAGGERRRLGGGAGAATPSGSPCPRQGGPGARRRRRPSRRPPCCCRA